MQQARKTPFGDFALPAIFGAIGVALLVSIIFFLRIYSASSESMAPTIPTGARVYVNPSSYALAFFGAAPRTPERGDIIAFRFEPSGPIFLGRVIGLPGESVSLNDGQVFIDAKPLARERLSTMPVAETWRETTPEGKHYKTWMIDIENPPESMAPHAVAPGCLFFLGDNRNNAFDSRFEEHRCVPIKGVIGEAFFILGGENESSGK